MPLKFSGFPQSGVDFLKKLKKNNNRDWFNSRKEIFEQDVKAPMISLVEAYNSHLTKLAPNHLNPPAKAIYRIYRDTRFSQDKTPYKTHIGAIFPHEGMEKHASGGYFFSIGADGIEFAAGLYMPEPGQLLAVRNHIVENHQQFRRIVENKALRQLMGDMKGEQLTRPPRGFAPDHPAVDFLRHKRWIFYDDQTIDLSTATTPKLLETFLIRTKALAPFVEFLNQPLLGLRKRKETTRELFE